MNIQEPETVQQILNNIDTYIQKLEDIALGLERLNAPTCNVSKLEQKISVLQHTRQYTQDQWEAEMDKIEALQENKNTLE